MTRPRKKSRRKRDSNPGSSAIEADALPLGQRGGLIEDTDDWTVAGKSQHMAQTTSSVLWQCPFCRVWLQDFQSGFSPIAFLHPRVTHTASETGAGRTVCCHTIALFNFYNEYGYAITKPLVTPNLTKFNKQLEKEKKKKTRNTAVQQVKKGVHVALSR